jgi:hypothetical protein
MRTRVYNSIVQLLSDRRWHAATDLQHVTSYPTEWLRELEQDPRFDVDATSGKIRLRDDVFAPVSG